MPTDFCRRCGSVLPDGAGCCVLCGTPVRSGLLGRIRLVLVITIGGLLLHHLIDDRAASNVAATARPTVADPGHAAPVARITTAQTRFVEAGSPSREVAGANRPDDGILPDSAPDSLPPREDAATAAAVRLPGSVETDTSAPASGDATASLQSESAAAESPAIAVPSVLREKNPSGDAARVPPAPGDRNRTPVATDDADTFVVHVPRGEEREGALTSVAAAPSVPEPSREAQKAVGPELPLLAAADDARTTPTPSSRRSEENGVSESAHGVGHSGSPEAHAAHVSKIPAPGVAEQAESEATNAASGVEPQPADTAVVTPDARGARPDDREPDASNLEEPSTPQDERVTAGGPMAPSIRHSPMNAAVTGGRAAGDAGAANEAASSTGGGTAAHRPVRTTTEPRHAVDHSPRIPAPRVRQRLLIVVDAVEVGFDDTVVAILPRGTVVEATLHRDGFYWMPEPGAWVPESAVVPLSR